MLRNIAIVLLGVLFASELKNTYHHDEVKVYLLLTQSGEENTTLLPIVMSSNFPENITLKDLLSSIPEHCKINLPHLSIVPETGVSANVHNYSTMMDETYDNNSHIYRKNFHRFPNKSKHLNHSAINKNKIYKRSVILNKLHSKESIRDSKIIHKSEQKLNNPHGTVDNQSAINKSLAKEIDSENDTRDDLEENHISLNISQGVIPKKLYSIRSVKSNNIQAHSSKHKLSNKNETIRNESSIKKNLSDASISRNVSREEVQKNHDIRDVYYVVHTCSQKQCRIHQVVVLKRGTVQEEDLEAILKAINQSEYSTDNGFDGQNEQQVSFSAIISGMLNSHFRNLQWLLLTMFGVVMLTKFIYEYKRKVDATYLFMEESISDIKELADILKNYHAVQLILERRILLACNKETDNETQIRNMKDEIAHLKITIRNMHGSYTVDMDDFITTILNYLQTCLESGAESSTDEVQQWHANTVNYLNSSGQLM